MIIPNNLSELKDIKQWVNYIRLWNPTKHGGKGGYDKPPINPYTLRDARTNDPATWATYPEAAANVGRTARHRDTKHKDEHGSAPLVSAAIEGAGLVLAQGYCGVDFDGVIDKNGNLAPFVARILDVLDTYTEVSPSGNGLHCLLYCKDLLEAGRNFGKQFSLDARGRITDEAGKVYEIEVYFYTNGGRYFTVTGNVYRDRPIAKDKSDKLLMLYDFYTEKTKQHRAAQAPARSVGTLSNPSAQLPNVDANKTMIESALQVIDPSALDFGEWASIMTALKVLGFTLNKAEEWSAGNLCGRPNPKNDTDTNARRWKHFHFSNGDRSAAGIIINAAKARNWKASEAFTKEERTEYGRSLYTDEQRLKYGRSLYTEEERRQYGIKVNRPDISPEDERRFEAIAKALHERAKKRTKTQTQTKERWH